MTKDKMSKWDRATSRAGKRLTIVAPIYLTGSILVSLALVFMTWTEINSEYVETVTKAAKDLNLNALTITMILVLCFILACGLDASRTVLHSLFADIFGIDYPEWVAAFDIIVALIRQNTVLGTLVYSAINYPLNLYVDNELGFRASDMSKTMTK